MNQLKQDINENDLIHPNQRGFWEGNSCNTNLNELIEEMQRMKEKELDQRKKKVPVKERKKQYILFVDLK